MQREEEDAGGEAAEGAGLGDVGGGAHEDEEDGEARARFASIDSRVLRSEACSMAMLVKRNVMASEKTPNGTASGAIATPTLIATGAKARPIVRTSSWKLTCAPNPRVVIR